MLSLISVANVCASLTQCIWLKRLCHEPNVWQIWLKVARCGRNHVNILALFTLFILFQLIISLAGIVIVILNRLQHNMPVNYLAHSVANLIKV